MNGKIKLVVVDDHEVVREGLVRIFSDNEKIEIIGKYGDGPSFLESVMELRPDVVLMDISLKGNKSGLTVTKDLLQNFPDVNVIMLTIHISSNYVFEAVKIGARGYFTKHADITEIIRAVEKVSYDKEFYMCEEARDLISKEFVASLKGEDNFLTDLERKIISLICSGKNNKEIAEEMELSPKTISNYKAIILDKMKSKNDIELVVKAIQEKIVSNE